MQRFASLVIFLFLLFGGWCYYDRVNNFINFQANFGTLKGIEGCVLNISSTLVQASTKRDFCADSFQIENYLANIKGFARPDFLGSGQVFSATVRNEELEWIITQIDVKIVVGEGDKSETLEAFEQVWLEPNSQIEVKFDLDSISDEAWETWRKCRLADPNGECFSWNVVRQFGVRLVEP